MQSPIESQARYTLGPNNILIAGLALICLLMVPPLSAEWLKSLNDAEVESLTSLASAQHRLAPRLRTYKRNAALNVEVLLVELQEKKLRRPEDPRLAEVFLYDYNTNSTSVQLINIDTQHVVSIQHIDSVHLPLNSNEVQLAQAVLKNNKALNQRLNTEYQAQFSKALPASEQLSMKVSIWVPAHDSPESMRCSRIRCALVSIFTQDLFNFSVEPVVDLENSNIYLDLVK